MIANWLLDALLLESPDELESSAEENVSSYVQSVLATDNFQVNNSYVIDKHLTKGARRCWKLANIFTILMLH